MMIGMIGMSDRFYLIDKSRLPFPGKCACCGEIDRDCVDFGRTVDWEGATLLCTVCVAEAFSVLDPVVDQEKKDLQAEVVRARETLGELRGNLLAVIDSSAYGLHLHTARNVPDVAGGSKTVKAGKQNDVGSAFSLQQ